jgi:hypothetical protein
MAKRAAAKVQPKGKSIYDVAISFLAQDEATARALHEELEAAGLKVFFFPRRQKELAGTNGMESMREPFLLARVNVVLFRSPWGDTPWTRVEDGAISERCFKGGWSSLMFVQLDKASPLPKWLPSTHIRFGFADYGLNQLVGAIKLRVQEHGGEMKQLDALGKARRVKREEARPSTVRDRSDSTSYALSGEEKKAREAGCDDYVPKPFSPRQLLAKIRQYLS